MNRSEAAIRRERDKRVAKRRALEKMPLTAEEKARWAPMLHDTWQAIGGDVMQAMREAGEKLTVATIVEVTCDANYVQMYGGMTNEEYEFLGVVYDRSSTRTWLRQTLNY